MMVYLERGIPEKDIMVIGGVNPGIKCQQESFLY